LHHGAGGSALLSGSSKAMFAEIEKVRRHLKKGRSLDDWRPFDIPEPVFRLMKSSSDPVDTGRRLARAQERVARRDAMLAAMGAATAKALGQLARKLKTGDISVSQFVDEGVDVLHDSFVSVYEEAARQAAEDHDVQVTDQMADDLVKLAEERSGKEAAGPVDQGQRGWLMRLAHAVLNAEDPEDLANRLRTYTGHLASAYEEGYGRTVLLGTPRSTDATGDVVDVNASDLENLTGATMRQSPKPGRNINRRNYKIVWVAMDDDHTCDLCEGRDGQEYTIETLPGFPGSGHFGGPICRGGQLCRCHLEYVQDNKTIGVAENPHRQRQLDDIRAGKFRVVPARRAADAAAREEQIASLPDTISQQERADAAREGRQPMSTQARARLRELIRQELALQRTQENLRNGVSPATVEPWDIPAKDVAEEFKRRTRRDQIGKMFPPHMFATPWDDFDETVTKDWSSETPIRDGAAVDDATHSCPECAGPLDEDGCCVSCDLYVLPIGAIPVPGMVTTEPEKAASLGDTVYSLLARDYPPSTITWARHAKWTFQPKVALTRVLLDRRPSGRDQAKVRAMEDALRNGQQFPPLVLVRTSENRFKIADGYHRALAYRHAGRTFVPAYVAYGLPDSGPWDREMHEKKLTKWFVELNPAVLAQLSIGDMLIDDQPVTFRSAQPDSCCAMLTLVGHADDDLFVVPPNTRMVVKALTPTMCKLELEQ